MGLEPRSLQIALAIAASVRNHCATCRVFYLLIILFEDRCTNSVFYTSYSPLVTYKLFDSTFMICPPSHHLA